HRFESGEYNNKYLSNSTARFARTRLTFGLVHKFSEAKQIGLYYRQGLSSSDQEDLYQSQDKGPQPTPATSLFGKTNISTVSSELGFRLRAPLTKRLFYGVEGSYLYERTNASWLSSSASLSGPSERSYLSAETSAMNGILDQSVTRNRYLARRARL